MRLEFFQKKMFKHLDWLLLGIIFAIVIFGVVAITSLTSPGYDPETMSFGDFIAGLNFKYSALQLMFFGMGIVAIFVVLLLDYNNLRDFSNILYWISVALLLAVLVFSTEIRGIAGWFMIGSFGFQPAEYCKIIMILVLAKEFAQRTEGKEDGITTLRELLPILWRFAIPFVLIMLQPDWGTAMVYIFVLGGIMFMSKTSLKLIGGLVLSGVVMIPVLWQFMDQYQKNRFLSFINPEQFTENISYNINRAQIVAGSGGANGKGLFSPDLLTGNSGYLPEQHTDFIFAGNTEAVGFWGGVILLLLYLGLIVRLLVLSMRAKDKFGSYIIIGVASMLLFHIFENTAMNIGAMPITGIPLPFFSYGGSNMLTMMISIALVLNVNIRRTRLSI